MLITYVYSLRRVYCDKIMREMFSEESTTTPSSKEFLSRSSSGTIDGEVAVKKKKEKSYYATSMAVRAVLGETRSHHTRKFLHMNSQGGEPQLSAKHRSRRGVIGAKMNVLLHVFKHYWDTGESSTYTNGTDSLLSFDDSEGRGMAGLSC